LFKYTKNIRLNFFRISVVITMLWLQTAPLERERVASDSLFLT